MTWGIIMSYDIKYDDKNCVVMITKLGDEEWFTPSDIVYDVEHYTGLFKETSVNLDVVVPVNNFDDYAYTYSNVLIKELNVNTNNDIVGTSVGDSFFNIKDIIFPILNEIYETHNSKTVHLYFEDREGYVKYLFLELVYDNGSILIIYNNTTDPLLKSQQDTVSDSEYINDKSYVFVKDINGNYFWKSHFYELIGKERNNFDHDKDILYELVVPEDKELYLSLIDNEVNENNIVNIKTYDGVKKTLKINSEHLQTNGSIPQTAVYITDITDEFGKKDEKFIMNIFRNANAKLGAGHVIRKTNGEYIISDVLYDITHLSKEEAIKLHENYEQYLVDDIDKIEIGKYVSGDIDTFEKIVRYKSPNWDAIQYLFIYLEHYYENENRISFMGVKDVSKDFDRERSLIEKNNENKMFVNLVTEINEHLGVAAFIVNLDDHKFYGVEDTAKITHIDIKPPLEMLNEFKDYIVDKESYDSVVSKVYSDDLDKMIDVYDYKDPKTGKILKLQILFTKKTINGKQFYLGGVKDLTDEYNTRADKEIFDKIVSKLNMQFGTGNYVVSPERGTMFTKEAEEVANLHYCKDYVHDLGFHKDFNGVSEEEIMKEFNSRVLDDGTYEELYGKVLAGELDKMDYTFDYQYDEGDIRKLHFILQKEVIDDDIYFVAGNQDITAEVKREEKLMKQNESLKVLSSVVEDIQESTSLAIHYMDSDGKYHWSPETYKLIDREPREGDEDTNIFIPLMDYDDHLKIEDKLNNVIDDKFLIDDFVLTTESGKTKFIRATARNIYDDDGNFLRLNMSAQDITKDKTFADHLIETDREKTVLLQEVHHRVRNNLQIIMSFINLEKRFHKGEYEKIIDITERRIGSLALIHERIYKDENMNNMNVPIFLADLDKQLYSRAKISDINFIREIDDDFTFSINVITPLSLIINELTINSFNYAFDENYEDKTIYKSLELFEKDGETFCRFEFKDNGKGVDENNDLKSKGLGWQIITSLVSQMDAEYEIVNENGLGVILTFPVK